MDGAKKIPQFIKGPEFAAWYPPTDPADFISLPTPTQGPPLAAVFLTTGTAWIGWGEIYDLRSPQESLGSLTASGSFIGHDEGLLLGSVTHLNVTGPGASATISGSYMTINVPQPSIMGWDDGAPVGTGTILEAGRNLQMSISGSVLLLDVVGGGTDNVYFFRTSGSDVGSYYYMMVEHGTDAEQYLTQAIGLTGTIIAGFISIPGTPGADFMSDGFHHVHVHANKSAGTKDIRLVWQLFRYTLGGAEIPLLTSEMSNVLTGVEAEYNLELFASEMDLDIGDRLIVKVSGLQEGAGSTPTARIGIEGTTFSRLEVPAVGGTTTTVNPPITGSFVIEEEGVVLGSATELNFIGASVTAALVGPRADITIVGGAGGGSGTIVVLDDGAVLGSSDWLNFRNGLIVGLSGSYATVDAFIAPLQIDNGLGYFTFTGIYIGSPQAELVASQGLSSHNVGLGANALLERMAGVVDLTANAPGYTASGLTIGTLTLTNRTGTVWIEAYADSLGEPYWFQGMSLGHNAAPRYMLDTAAGTVLAGSGFFVRELPGSSQGNLASAEGVFFAKASDGHPYYAAPDGTEYDLTTGLPGPAGPPGAFGVMGWDEGIPLGTGTILNVTGDGASLSLSGTVLELNVPGPFLQDDGAPLGYLSAIDFVGAGVTATLVGTQATVTIPGGGTTLPPITGSFVIEEEGVVLGSATELNFIGAAVTATLVGPRADITITASGGGGYPRCAVPILLEADYYQVPDYPYLTGSLMVFTNGVAQRPGVDFIEWSAASGIFQYVTSPPTGASHVAYYGK